VIGASKLTEKDVREIKHLFETTKLTDRQISMMYNVSRVHINGIRNGRRWNEDIRSFTMKGSLKPDVVFDTITQRPVLKKKNIFQKTCRAIAIFFLSLS